MPSRRHDQNQSRDAQPGDEQRTNAPSVDAIAMWKEDHQRVCDLFAHSEAAHNAEAKRRMAQEVFVALETHTQLEETLFSPSVNEETEEGPALIIESLQEHATVKQLMQALRQMGPQSHECDAKCHALRHNVEYHVQEEEAAMFPLADEELAEDLEEMRAEMHELKQECMASELNPRSPVHAVQGTAPASRTGLTMRDPSERGKRRPRWR